MPLASCRLPWQPACYQSRQRKGNSQAGQELYVSSCWVKSSSPTTTTAMATATTSKESLQFAIVQVEIYFDGKCDNAKPFIFTRLQLGMWLRATSPVWFGSVWSDLASSSYPDLCIRLGYPVYWTGTWFPASLCWWHCCGRTWLENPKV